MECDFELFARACLGIAATLGKASEHADTESVERYILAASRIPQRNFA
jgi:hypothetical protein